MRKLRDRLNKKGFTLVELIVVIVIVLILAAALVPNVMRYIDKAKQSAFQAEASAYMTEMQGYVTEYYATQKHALDGSTVSIGGSDVTYDWAYSKYKVTQEDTKNIKVTVQNTTVGTYTSAPTEPVEIVAFVKKASNEEFIYATQSYWVKWTRTGGWEGIKAF